MSTELPKIIINDETFTNIKNLLASNASTGNEGDVTFSFVSGNKAITLTASNINDTIDVRNNETLTIKLGAGLADVTSVTATSDKVLNGYNFVNSSGEKISGAIQFYNGEISEVK